MLTDVFKTLEVDQKERLQRAVVIFSLILLSLCLSCSDAEGTSSGFACFFYY